MIYVDDFGVQADVHNEWTGRTVRGNWHHLISDQVDPSELHEFAVKKLGLKRQYFQEAKGLRGEPDPAHDHYDVTNSKRQLALSKGATPVSWHELAAIITAKREEYRKGLISCAHQRLLPRVDQRD